MARRRSGRHSAVASRERSSAGGEDGPWTDICLLHEAPGDSHAHPFQACLPRDGAKLDYRDGLLFASLTLARGGGLCDRGYRRG